MSVIWNIWLHHLNFNQSIQWHWHRNLEHSLPRAFMWNCYGNKYKQTNGVGEGMPTAKPNWIYFCCIMWCDLLVTLDSEVVYVGRMVKLVWNRNTGTSSNTRTQQKYHWHPPMHILQRFVRQIRVAAEWAWILTHKRACGPCRNLQLSLANADKLTLLHSPERLESIQTSSLFYFIFFLC